MLGEFHTEPADPAHPELEGSFHFRSHFSDRLPNREDVISQFVISGLLVMQQKENKDRKWPRRIQALMSKTFLKKWSLEKVWFIHSACHNPGCSVAGWLRVGMAAAHRIPEFPTRHPSYPIPSLICCVVQFVYGRCLYFISLQPTLTKGFSVGGKLLPLQVSVISREEITPCL